MTALTRTTATTLATAMRRLAAFGIDAEAFCATYGIEPRILAGALSDEEPTACPRLLVKALRLLTEVMAEDYETP